MKRLLGIALCIVLAMSVLVGYSQTASVPAAKYTAGTFEASSTGMNGPVPVTVVVTDEKIESVTVGENKETLGLGDIAAAKLPARIVENQSLAVDSVSGATITSFAILRAAEDALKQAGADITALKQELTKAPLEKGETETVDIVIVGGGLAGIMAAYDLKVKNPDISYIVLEQLDVIMGNLPMAGGAIIAPKSKLHTEKGLESSIEDIIKLMEVATGAPVREDYIRGIYSNAEELFDRLVEWGAPLDNPTLSREASSDKVYAFWADGRGAGFAKFFNDYVERNPINLRLRSKATELIVQDGSVIGVKVRDDAKEYEIHAKAVLLATGGFGMNQELIKKYSPLYVGGVSRTGAGATGDGFYMTEQFNPEIVGHGMISGQPRASFALGSLPPMLAVSTEGTRFANENNGPSIVEGLGGGKLTGYKLADAGFEDQKTLQAHIDAGLIKPFDTLEELAKAKGINEANLLATVAAYNAAVDAGQSPGFDLPADKARKLETAPFYAEKIITGFLGSVPGLKVDDNMRILDGSGAPVPGLYGAGELLEGNMWSGNIYPGSGVGISYATYSGPYAVRCIVDDIK